MKLFEAFARALFRRAGGHNSKSPPSVEEPASGAVPLKAQLDRLRAREQELRITLMSMGDGVIATDDKGIVTFLNPSAQELTGWTQEQAMGKPFADIFRIYDGITGASGENIVETVLTTRSKVNLANHTVLIRQDGIHRHISDSAAPIHNVDGAVSGVVLIFSDVTERYLLQQKLRVSEARSTAAVEMVRLGTWEYDVQANAVSWSGTYKEIMGVPQDFNPSADFWNTLVHPDDLQETIDTRSRAMAEGKRYTHQYRIYRAHDGALRYVKTYANVECDDSGRVLKMIGVLQDITDEMEVGERIRESEELYRSAFEQSVVGMAHIGLDGRFLRVNRSLCAIFLCAPEKLLYHSVEEFIHPGDAGLLRSTLEEIIQRRGTTKEALRRFYRSDGEVVWLSVSSSLLLGRGGERRYIVSSIQDVTDRVKAQAALAQSEQRLRRAQEIAHTGNWEIDLDARRMWASDEAFRIYGYEKTEGNILPLSVPQSAVLPEQRKMMDDALDRLIKHNTPYDIEFTIRRLAGGHRVVHSIAVAERDQDGRALRIAGVLQDVTERRRIEEEYGKALATTLDGFLMCDNQTRIVLVNDAMCAMLGHSAQDLIGMPIHALEVQMDTNVVRARRQRVLSSGAERFEAQMRRKDGTIFDVEVSLSFIPSSESTCAFIRDITQRKRWETHIRHLSYHDVLTGLNNRAYFEMECARLESLKAFPVTVVMGDINGLKLTNDVFGHAQGDKLLCTIADIIKSCARPQDVVARIGGDEFCVLMPNAGPEEARALCERIDMACARGTFRMADGSELHPSVSVGHATRWTAESDFNGIYKEAEDAMYKRKLLERKSMHSALVASIRTTMYEKSRETREHADRLADMACGLAREMGLDENQISEMELLCSLHDLGKIGIPEQILDKPGPLTEEEWFEMRKHPEIGYRIAQAAPELVSVAEGILYHHERWDGAGYPQGLSGTNIPLLSRILSVVDSFDAMTHDRVYHAAIPEEMAIAEIEACAGSQFDPDICARFLCMVRGR